MNAVNSPVPPTSGAGAYARVTTAAGARDLALGPRPLTIGSAGNCQVRLSTGPPMAAALTFENGAVILHQGATRQRQALRHGSKLQMAGLAIEILVPGAAQAQNHAGAAQPAAAGGPAVAQATGSLANRPPSRHRLAPHLHGWIVLSLLFLAFSGVSAGFAYLHAGQPSAWIRLHAVVRSVSLVYCGYCLAALALVLMNSTRKPGTLCAVAGAAVSTVSLGVVACLLGPGVPFARVFPAWLVVAMLFGIAGFVGLFLGRTQARPAMAGGIR